MNPSELFDSLPQEMKEQLRKEAKEHFRNDADVLKFLEFEEDLDAVNQQLCNTLGMIKQILSRFDEKGTSNDKAFANLRFFAKFVAIAAIPFDNLLDNVKDFQTKYKNMKGEGSHE